MENLHSSGYHIPEVADRRCHHIQFTSHKERFPMPNSRFTAVMLVWLLTLLAGCSQPGIVAPEPEHKATPLELAEQELSQAAGSITPQRQLHQLTAAELFHRAGDRQRALQILQIVDDSSLPDNRYGDFILLFAELKLESEAFFATRDLLTDSRMTAIAYRLPVALQSRWQRMRGELFSLLGEDENSIRAYTNLASLTEDTKTRQEVHEKLWQVLIHLSGPHLSSLLENETDPTLLGWYNLANLLRSSQGDVNQQLSLISEWRARWPTHPAVLDPPASLLALQQIADSLPRNIAVLLPFEGSLAQAGKAVRSGLLAAWYEAYGYAGKAPVMHFYDTSGTDNIVTLYQKAVTEGAELVIGPVQRETVEQLIQLPELPIPVIALNYLDSLSTSIPANFYQFGLSVSDEARQIADRAWLEGQRTALTITPNSGWGDRALVAFRERWIEHGGTLVEAPAYGTAQSDFAPLLRPTLHITQSEERKKRLQRLLGKSLNFTPRRRQDLDMVFMIAYPDQARQIKPTLDFLFASDLQIYSTSQLYTGVSDPGRNRDLESIRFSAMPWTLPGAQRERLQPSHDLQPIYRHLFALGIDAYHLHQGLPQMLLLPDLSLSGSTGTLQLDKRKGAIMREQPWAEFKGGRVKPAQQLKLN
ncbi:MAG: penicillin-binding protein activator [Gammaproteobacteria bacterium]|nr:MAG: penicillin-binding protein activator [Gammaproteobacteria bacterium]